MPLHANTQVIKLSIISLFELQSTNVNVAEHADELEVN